MGAADGEVHDGVHAVCEFVQQCQVLTQLSVKELHRADSGELADRAAALPGVLGALGAVIDGDVTTCVPLVCCVLMRVTTFLITYEAFGGSAATLHTAVCATKDVTDALEAHSALHTAPLSLVPHLSPLLEAGLAAEANPHHNATWQLLRSNAEAAVRMLDVIVSGQLAMSEERALVCLVGCTMEPEVVCGGDGDGLKGKVRRVLAKLKQLLWTGLEGYPALSCLLGVSGSDSDAAGVGVLQTLSTEVGVSQAEWERWLRPNSAPCNAERAHPTAVPRTVRHLVSFLKRHRGGGEGGAMQDVAAS